MPYPTLNLNGQIPNDASSIYTPHLPEVTNTTQSAYATCGWSIPTHFSTTPSYMAIEKTFRNQNVSFGLQNSSNYGKHLEESQKPNSFSSRTSLSNLYAQNELNYHNLAHLV